MLIVREVYSDWSAEQRGTITIRRADTTGTAPPPPDTSALAKRYGVAGKILISRLQTFLAFPEWFYLNAAGQHADRAAVHARRADHPVLLGRSLRPGR